MTPELLTVREAAIYLGMKPSWLRASAVPKVRLPGRGTKRGAVRYSRTALDAWIRQHTINPAHPNGDGAGGRPVGPARPAQPRSARRPALLAPGGAGC
jgi:hypothetical protein